MHPRECQTGRRRGGGCGCVATPTKRTRSRRANGVQRGASPATRADNLVAMGRGKKRVRVGAKRQHAQSGCNATTTWVAHEEVHKHVA